MSEERILQTLVILADEILAIVKRMEARQITIEAEVEEATPPVTGSFASGEK